KLKKVSSSTRSRGLASLLVALPGEVSKGKNHHWPEDSRFGHGGRRGMKKQNTAETTNDLRGFNNNHKGEPGDKKRRMF
ncbi:hypothetical protein CFC21_090426, partial [Triticum aestivum]